MFCWVMLYGHCWSKGRLVDFRTTRHQSRNSTLTPIVNKISSVEWVQKTFLQVLKAWVTDWELASLIVLISQELSQERAPPSWPKSFAGKRPKEKRRKKKKSLPIRKSSEQDSDLTINWENGRGIDCFIVSTYWLQQNISATFPFTSRLALSTRSACR